MGVNVIEKRVSALLGEKMPQRRVKVSLFGRRASGIRERGETDGDSDKKDMIMSPLHKISLSWA